MEILQQIVVGLVGLSFLVFIHELGHFLVAKKFGVKVRTFSIGFGKKLLKFQWGETTYCISAIPFGGYVAMAGENPMEDADPQKGDFTSMSVPKRAGIALGGPLVNMVFAYLVLVMIYLVGVREPETDRLLVGSVELGSPGDSAGIRPGDTIVGVDGSAAKGWMSFIEKVGLSIGDTIPLTIKRDGQLLQKKIVPEELPMFGIGITGLRGLGWIVVPEDPAVGSAASLAGFRKNDTIRRVAGKGMDIPDDVVRMVMASEGRPLEFLIKRGKTLRTLRVKPRWNVGLKRHMIGLKLAGTQELPSRLVRRGFSESVSKAWNTSLDWVEKPFVIIGKIFEGKIRLKALSGPLGIIQLLGLTWMDGFIKLLWLLALISMNLGIINLLPLGITDGGILVFLGLEAILGKPVPRKFQLVVQQIFLVFFVSLALYITTQDIFRFSLFLR